MKKLNYNYNLLILLLFAFLLSSCDLLGIGDDDEKKKKKTEPQPELIWQSENPLATTLRTTPIIKDSVFYIAGRYGVQKALLKNGEAVWFNDIEKVNTFIAGKMKIDANNLYVHLDHAVKAYNLTDGIVKWSVTFENPLGAIEFSLPPAINFLDQTDTFLFATTQKELLIISKKRGNVEEVVAPEIADLSSSYFSLISPLVSEENNGVVFLLTVLRKQQSSPAVGYISAYNYIENKFIWQQKLPYPLPKIIDLISMHMAKVSNHLAVITGPALIVYDAKTGEKAWSRIFFKGNTDINIGGLLAKSEGSFYIATDAPSYIMKLEAESGKVIWKQSTDAAYGYRNRMFFEDGVLFLSADALQKRVILNVDASSGTLNYDFTTPESGIFAGLHFYFAADGKYAIIIGTKGIYAYKLP